MSVTNRKMFKRNARETLNQTAGIRNLPVQKFQAGGSVGTDNFRIGNQNYMITSGANPQVYLRTQTGASPVNANVAAQVLSRFRSPQLNTRTKFASNTGSSLPVGTVAPSGKVSLSADQTGGIASLIQQQDPNRPSTSLVESALRPNAPVQFDTRYPLSSFTEDLAFGYNAGAPKTTEEKALRTVVTAIPTALDFVGVPLIEAASTSQAAISRGLSMMTPEREEELLSGAGTLTQEEAERFNADPTMLPPRLRTALLSGDVESGGVDLIRIGAETSPDQGEYSKAQVSPEDETAALAVAGTMPGTQVGVTQQGPTFETIREAETYAKTYEDAATAGEDAATAGEDATAQAAGAEAAVATPEDREAVREAGTYEKEYTSAKEEIDRVITEGTPEEQKKTLDDFIKQFEESAPGYEGTNQGLILAKMGFAMAAGKSPRAIENIAAAMEQGAEDLIKDSDKKAEFDRQLKLSALQYGLTETGKLDAQRRTDDRNFIRLVDGDGNAHRISMTELLANDGKLPEGLQDADIYLSQEKAALERLEAVRGQTSALREELLLSDEQAGQMQGDYAKATKIYIDAEVGMEFAEKAVLVIADDGSITGIKGGIKDLSNKLSNAMGFDTPPSFQTKEEYRTFVNQAFQRLIPVSLGGVQSANSISNRDVEFLANAYVDATSLEGGSFSLAFADPEILQQKLQFTITELRKSQALAAAEMRGIENRLTNRILPGEGLGSGLSLIGEQQEALAPYVSQFGERSSTGLVDTGRKNDQGMPVYSFAE